MGVSQTLDTWLSPPTSSSVCHSRIWLPRSPLSGYPSAHIHTPAPSLQASSQLREPSPSKSPKLPSFLPRRCGVSPARGRSPLVCRIPVDRLQAEPRHQPQNLEQQQGPDLHAPRPRMGGPHDPAKAWGAGHQLPQSRSPPGGDCLGRPGYSARATRVADAPGSHADPLPAPPVPPLRSSQPTGALPGAVCRRPMPPAHAPAPRDRRAGLSRGLGEPGAGRGRHGAPGEGAGKGAPSRSPSLAGIEGSGLREETSPEPRRGELKERRGGGEDGGGKNRSWSPSRSWRQDRSPRPPPLSPRAPPARPAVSTPRPALLPCAVSHAPFVFATLGLWLSFCPPPLLPWDRRDGWNLPRSQIQKGSLALYIPRNPAPFPPAAASSPIPKQHRCSWEVWRA